MWLVALMDATALPRSRAPSSAAAARVATQAMEPEISAARSIGPMLFVRRDGGRLERHEQRRARRFHARRTGQLLPYPRESVLGALHDVQRLPREQRQRAAALLHLVQKKIGRAH